MLLLYPSRRPLADCSTYRSSSRSRRKSCQSCADSKVRCDLQRPCSKCKARGRECVYTNAPSAGSSARKNSSRNDGSSPEDTTSPASSSSQQGSSPEAGSSSQTSTSSTDGISGTTAELTFPSDLFGDLSTLTSFPSSTSVDHPAASVNDLLSSGRPTDPLSAALLGGDSTTTQTTGGKLSAAEAAALIQNGQLSQSNAQGNMDEAYSSLFSNTMYDGLFGNVFTSFQKNPAVPGQHFQDDPTSILTDRLEATGIDQAAMNMFFDTAAQLAIYPSLFQPLQVDPHASIPETEISEALTVRSQMPSVPEMYEYSTCSSSTSQTTSSLMRSLQSHLSSRLSFTTCRSSTYRHSSRNPACICL